MLSTKTMLESGSTFPENHVQVNETCNTGDGGVSYGLFQARRTTEKYGDYRNWNGVGVFEAGVKMVDDEESGVCSPPLWRTSPPRSPQHNKNHYRSLSPSSRAQAIARGQKELMEMVSRMPEGCYELSLRDLVEQSSMVEAEQKSFSQEKSMINSENDYHRRDQGKKKTDSKRVQLNRNGSMHNNGGPLLKMVFPISWGSNKKKKSNVSVMSNSAKDGRVSPKPLLSVDQDWWKKRYSDEGEESTESGRFSINSGSTKSTGSSSSRSSSRNSSRYRKGGCCLPFRSHDKTA